MPDAENLANLTVLQEQLLAAAEQFAPDAQPLSELLTAMVADVAHATAEPLEIFPVCHHSPTSALQIVRRLGRQSNDVERDRWRERYMWTRIKQHHD